MTFNHINFTMRCVRLYNVFQNLILSVDCEFTLLKNEASGASCFCSLPELWVQRSAVRPVLVAVTALLALVAGAGMWGAARGSIVILILVLL